MKLNRLFSRGVGGMICASALVSCASATLTVRSTPDKADVMVSSLGTSKSKSIGQTPVTISGNDLAKEFGGSAPVFVEIRKAGYAPVRTIITDLTPIDLSISMDLQPLSGLEDPERINALIDLVFESQRLARIGRHDDALAKLKEVEKEAPQFAATYEIQGGVFYLQNKYREALDAYSQATKYNPKNMESIRMRNFLETSLGVKRKGDSEVDAPPAKAAAR